MKDDAAPQSGPRVAVAAQWAQKAELVTCLAELFDAIGNPNMTTKRLQLCRQEAHLEQSLLGDRAIGKKELVASGRNLSALASLYRSVVCIASLRKGACS